MNQEQLKPEDFCATCRNKAFSPAKGIYCSLTGEKGVFLVECSKYQKDEKAYENWINTKKKNERRELIEKTGGLSTLGINSGILAGIVYIAFMFILELCILFYFKRIAVIPVMLMFFGAVLTFRGLKSRAKKGKPNDIIDNFQ